MSNLFHRDYQPGDLEPATGPIPTYANPGALANLDGEHWAARECRMHGVRWRGDEDCWLCSEGLEVTP